jgi:signal transduction histidine kinase
MGSALLLLWAALQFAAQVRWRPHYVLAPLLAVVWAWYSVFVIHDMATAGLSSALLLSAVTLGTAYVFMRQDRAVPSTGARLLSWAFLLWGLHHLDYPLLRSQGAGVLLGVFVDVTLLVLVAMGTLTLVLGEERTALEHRSAQLEQLSALLLRAQEEERRRIARELHDQVGQTLTALKIELDLEGRREASGLVPALRALVDDFSRRTQIPVAMEADDPQGWAPETALTLYRVAQEALTNVARHSGAKQAWVRLVREGAACRLVVEDDGRGLGEGLKPHLGLMGMRERVTAAGGTLRLERASKGGLRVEADLPMAVRA